MSGIAGLVRPGGGAGAAVTLQTMAQGLPVPPDTPLGEWRDADAALACRPLHATAQSLAADQPLASIEGDLAIVFDGYLANPDELRDALSAHGIEPRSQADAELVLLAYRQWGSACPDRLEGEFALAIWDRARRELFCARDHQGLRPFYYHWDGAQFAFGSGMAAVLEALGREPRANRGYMAEVMADRWYSVDETVWQEVRRLPPAHSLRLVGGEVKLKRYWTLDTAVTIRYRRDEDYFAHYRELFADCVRRASRSHAPLAVEVSGGLDSSAVFAMADALEHCGELGAPELHGYSLYGPPGSAADERSFVAAMARHTGRPIAELPLFCATPECVAEEALRYRDFANYPNGSMALAIDRQMAADGCRVKLTGLGGDQWLDGSRRYYREALVHGDWRGLATSLTADLRDLGPGQTAGQLARGMANAVLPDRLLEARRRKKDRRHKQSGPDCDWLTSDLRAELDRRHMAYRAQYPILDGGRYKLEKLQFPNLPLALELLARQSSHTGIEARHPLLSRRFIEFSAATPEHVRLRGSLGKFVHRRALADLLPSEISTRRSKGEFSHAFDGMADAIESTITEADCVVTHDLLDRRGIRRLLTTYRSATIDEAPFWPVWGIYLIFVLLLQEDARQEASN